MKTTILNINASLVALLMLVACATQSPESTPLDRINGNFLNMSVVQLQAAMGAGNATAVEITRFYKQRIADLNPVYHAVINVNPDADDIAAELDLERKQGKIRGPLHGIPVLLKDNINSRDPMPTTAGSLALAENYALEDAPLELPHLPAHI